MNAEKEYPFIIDIRPPDGEFYCDVCNKMLANQVLSLDICFRTDWGLYCWDCAAKYINKARTQISGYDILQCFVIGQELKF